MKRALISGITGQDGSYLAEFLLEKGYEVHGIVRRSSRGYGAYENIRHLINDPTIHRHKLIMHVGDICDMSSLVRIFQEVRPDEIYNLAAQADVGESFYQPEYTHDATGLGVVRMLEAFRRFAPSAKFYQASTSELFGKTDISPQDELTPFNPQSPYAVAKFVGFQSVKNAREGYKLFACNGILFNHASERRTDDYLDRKVTKAVARIKCGLQESVRLGNLESKRDWGYAKEYVTWMWKMLQMDKPDDYILGTGETHTVREFVETAFAHVGLDPYKYIVTDPALFRPNEVDILHADFSKAKEVLGFEPKVKFQELIQIMVDHDLKQAELEAKLYV